MELASGLALGMEGMGGLFNIAKYVELAR